ncbi:MAG: hypothetical protein JXA96_13620 [Sedimentisphaerales bacterium]|nr:hypothetical protein [Sedimentisphaerales bacterium]
MNLSFENKTFISYILGIFLFCFISQNTVLSSISNRVEDDEKQKQDTIKSAETNIVGKIDDYTITMQELEKRLISELQPDPYRLYTEQATPYYDANSMLLQMLGEKAVVMEARKQGRLEEEMIQQNVMNERRKRIVNLWVQDIIKKENDKIAATEEEIDKQIKADPKTDRAKAKSAIETAKANKIIDQYYANLYKKSEVKKITENFSKVIEIHDRLLNQPVKPRPSSFIRDYQLKEELTEEEKNLPLAIFIHGKITLLEWFDVLCDFSPPSRPKNLNTEKGVDQLLEKALIKPLIMAEVHELGMDNDPGFLKQIRDFENELLLNNVKNLKHNDNNEPSAEEILTFFNKNKEFFITDRIMNIDQIWCKNLETAKLVKKEIDSGKDFNDVKKEYSLYPDSRPYKTSLNNEGYFWKEIWPGQQNEIIGPVKGFHSGGIRWRVVKIIEKQQGTQKEYSKELETTAKYLMIGEMAIKEMADYCLESLKKYPYEIYSDKIKDINPMNIP